MTTPAKTRKPDDPAWPGLTLDDLCFTYEEGVYGEVRDATTCTRGQAIAYFASETTGRFTDVRCLVRYVLLFTRQDAWEEGGRDRAADDLRIDKQFAITPDEAQTPEVVPDDWVPEEQTPCWSACRKDHPRARKVWMCEMKGDDRIPDPPERAS